MYMHSLIGSKISSRDYITSSSDFHIGSSSGVINAATGQVVGQSAWCQVSYSHAFSAPNTLTFVLVGDLRKQNLTMF